MEKQLQENIHIMWLSGMSRPDFRTINRFRSERLTQGRLDAIFTKVVELLNDEGFVSLNVQYIDGTKIESVANEYTFVWKGSVEKNKAKLDEYDHHLEELGERNSYSKTDPDATFMRMKEDAMNNGQTKPGYNVQISTENQFITNYGIYWRPTDTGTMIPYLESFMKRYGKQSAEIVADSGYGCEQNYEYMLDNGMVPYVKFNMFHNEQARKYKNNPFLPANMYYNKDEDYFVCPMGHHLEHTKDCKSVSDMGYESVVSVYRVPNCKRCPLREMCYKGKSDRRTIEVNHKSNGYREKARELLNSKEGMRHRSNRPIEPEAVFGNIKFNQGFKRFKLKSKEKVSVE